MSRAPGDPQHDNPFSTRHTRPGALPFAFEGDRGDNEARFAELVARLRASGWRGQIVGPHGSGKSTLLAALVPHLRAAARRPIVAALREAQRRLPDAVDAQLSSAEGDLLVVDGYEQLSRWNRWRLERRLRAQQAGILATTHLDLDLPLLIRLEPSLALAQRLVELLQAGYPARIDSSEVAQAYQRCGGDLRELFFELYDLYESRRTGNR